MPGISGAIKDVFIVVAKRTAFGKFGSKLRAVPPVKLIEHATRAALQASNLDPGLIDSVVLGQTYMSSARDLYLPRTVGLRCGIPLTTPGLVVQRLAGTGYNVVIQGAQELMFGDLNFALVGGVDNMSMCPDTIPHSRFERAKSKFPDLYSKVEIEHTLYNSACDPYTEVIMGMTAELLATKYGITREESDAYALQSHTRWGEAHKAGAFNAEIAPIKLDQDSQIFEVDEHPRPNSSLEQLAKLPTVFKEGGCVTAANASGVNDGAAALILATGSAVTKYNLEPLARIVSFGIAGCEPELMGIGPVPASRLALKAADKSIDDMDMIEINEAFACQYLSVEKALDMDPKVTNMHGGGISIGHPIAATGSRVIGHIAHHLSQNEIRHGLAASCIGGGQGIAVILEKC